MAVKRPDGPSEKAAKGAKRTYVQKAFDRAEMMKMLARGATVTMIATKFGLHVQTIIKERRDAVRELVAQHEAEAIEWLNIKLLELAEIKREAWDAWERSKLPKESTSTTTSDAEDGDTKETHTTEGQVGNIAFLRMVADLIVEECRLLSLYPDKKAAANLQNAVAASIWDKLTDVKEGEAVPDDVEAEIQKLVDAKKQIQYGMKELPPDQVIIETPTKNGENRNGH